MFGLNVRQHFRFNRKFDRTLMRGHHRCCDHMTAAILYISPQRRKRTAHGQGIVNNQVFFTGLYLTVKRGIECQTMIRAGIGAPNLLKLDNVCFHRQSQTIRQHLSHRQRNFIVAGNLNGQHRQHTRLTVRYPSLDALHRSVG